MYVIEIGIGVVIRFKKFVGMLYFALLHFETNM